MTAAGVLVETVLLRRRAAAKLSRRRRLAVHRRGPPASDRHPGGGTSSTSALRQGRARRHLLDRHRARCAAPDSRRAGQRHRPGPARDGTPQRPRRAAGAGGRASSRQPRHRRAGRPGPTRRGPSGVRPARLHPAARRAAGHLPRSRDRRKVFSRNRFRSTRIRRRGGGRFAVGRGAGGVPVVARLGRAGSVAASHCVTRQTGTSNRSPTPRPDDCPVGPPGRWIIDPDGAVVRSGLVRQYAVRHGLWQLDPKIAYLSGDELPPATRGFEVLRANSVRRAAVTPGARRDGLRRRGNPGAGRRRRPGGAAATAAAARVTVAVGGDHADRRGVECAGDCVHLPPVAVAARVPWRSTRSKDGA